MTRRSISSLALISFLAGGAAMFAAPQLLPEAQAGRAAPEVFEAPPMREGADLKKWEYFEVVGGLGSKRLNLAREKMNKMGAEGWVLVSTIYSDAGGAAVWFFKRPLP